MEGEQTHQEQPPPTALPSNITDHHQQPEFFMNCPINNHHYSPPLPLPTILPLQVPSSTAPLIFQDHVDTEESTSFPLDIDWVSLLSGGDTADNINPVLDPTAAGTATTSSAPLAKAADAGGRSKGDQELLGDVTYGDATFNSIRGAMGNNNSTGRRMSKKLPIAPPRFEFHTKSTEDVLDDGYKWRKYGQKAVKNSKYPRSYYRCMYHTCKVKKQIQRLSRDTTIVVTTYEGIHNHPCEKLMETLTPLLRQLQFLSGQVLPSYIAS